MKNAIRLLTTAMVVSAIIYTGTASATAVGGQESQAILDYIAAVNRADIASVRQLRDHDLSSEFTQMMGEADLLQFFRNQRRVTGGLDFVSEHAGGDGSNTIEVVVRDHVYGALHSMVMTLDGRSDRRISDFEPAETTPTWALAQGKVLDPTSISARTRELVARGCRAGVFSGAVLVAHNDTLLVQQACGAANRRYDARNSVETRFNLGSMNKMFTAVAVLQLIEAGKLSLNDPLSRFADETWLPNDISSRITIQQLLRDRLKNMAG